jgi:hypothetical protein
MILQLRQHNIDDLQAQQNNIDDRLVSSEQH